MKRLVVSGPDEQVDELFEWLSEQQDMCGETEFSFELQDVGEEFVCPVCKDDPGKRNYCMACGGEEFCAEGADDDDGKESGGGV